MDPKFFWDPQIFVTQNFFISKKCWKPTLFGTVYWTQGFFKTQNFSDSNFDEPKIFRPTFFEPKIFNEPNFSWTQDFIGQQKVVWTQAEIHFDFKRCLKN